MTNVVWGILKKIDFDWNKYTILVGKINIAHSTY
jgi:hypothetical protein